MDQTFSFRVVMEFVKQNEGAKWKRWHMRWLLFMITRVLSRVRVILRNLSKREKVRLIMTIMFVLGKFCQHQYEFISRPSALSNLGGICRDIFSNVILFHMYSRQLLKLLPVNKLYVGLGQ